jgi:effector-binding domain-containing protein
MVASKTSFQSLSGGDGAIGVDTPGSMVLRRSNLSNLTHYLGIRHVGSFQDVNATWARLTQYAFSRGLAGPHVVAFATVCPCNKTQPQGLSTLVQGGLDDQQDLRLLYDACLSISEDQFGFVVDQMTSDAETELTGLRAGSLTVGETQVIIHRGPYNLIGSTYRAALAAGATLSFSPDGENGQVAFEVYRNNPLLTKAEALITEIHFPLGHASTRSRPLTGLRQGAV